MSEYRYAVLGGVPSGARGGFRLEGLCRRSRQAQVSRRDASARAWRTIRREAVRGNWKGEQSLCQNAVVSVQRQLMAIKPSVSGNKNNAEKQTYQTQGVGIATQA